MPYITEIYAREVLDSRGIPTVEVELFTESNIFSRVQVPSEYDVKNLMEFRDKDSLGVTKAIESINKMISKALIGEDVRDQLKIDSKMNKIDPSLNKSKLGINSMMAVSLASSIAASSYSKLNLYRYYGGMKSNKIPTTIFDLMIDPIDLIKKVSIVPLNFDTFKDALKAVSKIRYNIYSVNALMTNRDSNSLKFNSTKELFDRINSAISITGFNQSDFTIYLELNPSNYYNNETKTYKIDGKELTNIQYIDYIDKLVKQNNIGLIKNVFIDSITEDYKKLYKRIGSKTLLPIDINPYYDLKKIEKLSKDRYTNTYILKLSKFATLTDFIETYKALNSFGFILIIESSLGEIESTLLSDLSVGLNANLIDFGSLEHNESISKYNELLRIESDLNSINTYSGKKYK